MKEYYERKETWILICYVLIILLALISMLLSLYQNQQTEKENFARFEMNFANNLFNN